MLSPFQLTRWSSKRRRKWARTWRSVPFQLMRTLSFWILLGYDAVHFKTWTIYTVGNLCSLIAGIKRDLLFLLMQTLTGARTSLVPRPLPFKVCVHYDECKPKIKNRRGPRTRLDKSRKQQPHWCTRCHNSSSRPQTAPTHEEKRRLGTRLP